MYCTKCGKPLSDDAKFCVFCGTGVTGSTAGKEIEERVPQPIYQSSDLQEANTPPVNVDTLQEAFSNVPLDPQPVQPYGGPSNKERKKLGKKAMLAIILSACAVVLTVVAVLIIPAVVEGCKGAKYESAMAFMDEGQYGEAKEAFLSLGKYEDAAELAIQCQNTMDYDAAKQLMDAGKYQETKTAFEALALYKDSKAKATECQNAMDYSTATALMASEDYEQAKEIFTKLGSYKDSTSLAGECEDKTIYKEAVALMEAGDYFGAREKLEPLAALGREGYDELIYECDCNINYARADAAFSEGKFYTAFKLFTLLGDFKDSAEQAYPPTGEIYRNSNYSGSAVTLKTETPKDDSRPTLLKIYSADGTLVLSLFIRGGESPSIKFPAGTYMIKSAYGEKWYGPEEMFGDDAVYQTLLLESSTTYAFKSNGSYTLTLRSATDGNVGTERESRDSF